MAGMSCNVISFYDQSRVLISSANAAYIRFLVHRDQLNETSEVFKTAFEATVREGVDLQSMTLPDEKPEVFNIFVSWLYSHTSLKKSDDRYDDLLRCFFFADKYDIQGLRDEAVDAFVAKLRRKDIAERETRALERIYETTDTDSRLRTLAIETWRRCVKLEWYAEADKQGFFLRNPAITRDLLVAIAGNGRQSPLKKFVAGLKAYGDW